mgnify:CR=1|jgi:hypothetical protein|tara:strand:- start:1409 stop:1801 length:393 start_codon:yes stop_codon:yes gene_type:complete
MLQAILGAAAPILDKFVEDKDAKNQIKAELEKQIVSLQAAQAAANVAQAKHSSLFVAGARPAIMWICALGLMTNFFLMPIAEWVTAIWAPGTPLPKLETEELMSLTLALLGLGSMRSWEKSKGVARENMK